MCPIQMINDGNLIVLIVFEMNSMCFLNKVQKTKSRCQGALEYNVEPVPSGSKN